MDNPEKPTDTWYELKRVKTDTSGCSWVEGKGTCYDPSAPDEFEFRVYEKDIRGYVGLCGQWGDNKKGYAEAILFLVSNITREREGHIIGQIVMNGPGNFVLATD